MRRAALLVAVALLASSPSWASGSMDSLPNFGRTSCGGTFACPSDTSSETLRVLANELLPLANNCVRTTFGKDNPGGFFEESMGLDSDNCLTTKTLPKETVGLTMVPQCCMVPAGRGTCQLVCKLYGVH